MLKTKEGKLKPCRECRKPFKPWNSTDIHCSGRCAVEDLKRKNEKIVAGRVKSVKKQARKNEKSYQRQRADYWFNRYIRLRDAADPCISCGEHYSGQYHAGHYRTKASCSARRFCEINSNKQCQPCNTELSGNVSGYREGLIRKAGRESVEAIDNDNRLIRRTIEEYKDIQSTYRAKCREIEASIKSTKRGTRQ